MRRLALAFLSIAWVLSAGRAWAHGAEVLGHHWEVPAYRIEMLTQTALMLGASLAVVVGVFIRNAIRRRRARE